MTLVIQTLTGIKQKNMNEKAKEQFGSILVWNSFLKEFQYHYDYKGLEQDDTPIVDHTKPYPIIDFHVTHKIGGCNMSIGWNAVDNSLFYQSREMLLTDQDYAGFKTNFSDYEEKLRDLFYATHNKFSKNNGEFIDNIVIYGEWCGKGVAEKAAIAKTLGKKWIIFAIKVDGEYVDNFEELQDNDIGIYNILKFENFKLTIDFNQFEEGSWKKKEIPLDLKKLVNGLTTNCPVSKFFGVEGIGEGLVFSAKYKDKDYKFKIKSDAYEKASLENEVKVVTENPELNSFVNDVCNESRLDQFANKLLTEHGELHPKHIPVFLKSILADILKEEQIVIEKWERAVENKARQWFLNKLK